MNNKKFFITEEDVNRIKDLYNINEQPTSKELADLRVARYRGGGEGTQGDRDVVTSEFKDIVKDFTVPGGMFLNGIDKIDTNSPEYKEGLDKIKSVLVNTNGKIDIGVKGGASKVGSSSGYDNEALANRRRDNFIKAIKNSLGSLSNRINFIPENGVVGDATEKNSPKANSQQFVKITYPDKVSIYNQKLEMGKESTDVAMGRLGDRKLRDNIIPIPDPEKKGNPYMIVKVYYRKGEKDSYKKKILDATGSPARELLNYQDAKNCGLRFE